MMIAQGGESLPAGYTKLEYLESDGTNYIDTGFKPSNNTRVIMNASLLSLDGDQYFYGAKDTGSTQSFVCAYSEGSITFGYGSSFPSASYNASVLQKISIDQNCNDGYINGLKVVTANDVIFRTPYSLYLCARNNGDSVTKLTKLMIYSCQIYDNDVKVRDYIPCTNPVGAKGLWDAVTEEFFAFTPAGYTRLAYLESNGSDYIDTGFKPKYTTRVVLDMSNLTEADKWIFGAKSSSSATSPEQFSICRRTATTIRSDYFGSSVSANMADTAARFTIDVDWNVVKIDGVESIVNTAVTSGTCGYNMYLFGLNIADTSKEASVFRIYSCKIYDNGVLVRDFIPCTNPDGISGLWDSVNDVFYKMLPAGYTKLDFIESDGTTYIDTGFKPNNNTRVVFEGYNNSTSSGWIFGAWKAANDSMFCASALNTYNVCYGAKIWKNATMPVGPISIDINKNAYTYNGVSGTLSEQTFSCDYPMYLFHINAAGAVSTGSFNGRIYSVKIYDNGTLVRDFIPAMNASGEAGLYDLKNDVWYALKPVVTKQKKNKITFSYYNDILENPVTGVIIIYTYITINSTYAITSDLDITFQNTIGVSKTFRMLKGSSVYTPAAVKGFGVPTLTSISPTEDDTYIYTF